MPKHRSAKTVSGRKRYKTPLRGFSPNPTKQVSWGPQFSRRAPAKPDARAAFPDARTLYLYVTFLVLSLVLFIFTITSKQTLECFYYHMPVDSMVKTNSSLLVSAETATSSAEQAKGLSGRPCIKDRQAMVFPFNPIDNSNHCFWMKDMRFAIDIIWLDKSGNVAEILRDVQPVTYPKTFCPGIPTSAVIEVKANAADKRGFIIGSHVDFLMLFNGV